MNETLIEGSSLALTVRHLIEQHLKSTGNGVIDLHQMVLEQIEPPLLQAVMEKSKYNQSRAAKLLGIS
jgi:Fis family transcriptional regulator